VGQKIKVYLTEVNHEAKGPVISLSRIHPKLVWRLFELEVPEIQDGIVIIRGVSREAGSRSKIAVYSRDADVDALGACIGNRNMRIDAIISELNGEKIDIVKYSDVPEEYIAAALAPATVQSVTMVGERACRVVVDPDQLSLAIGREGQNVRLAARLTGYKIDIKAE
jgi:N utilization substance protein A